LKLGRMRPVAIVFGWGTLMSGVILGAIFNGFLVPGVFRPAVPEDPIILAEIYALIFGVCFLGALITEEASTALVSFFAAYAVTIVLTYVLLGLPGFLNQVPISEFIIEAAIVFTFAALFPVALIVGLTATIIGIVLADWIR
jgi:hypothetical protein